MVEDVIFKEIQLRKLHIKAYTNKKNDSKRNHIHLDSHTGQYVQAVNPCSPLILGNLLGLASNWNTQT